MPTLFGTLAFKLITGFVGISMIGAVFAYILILRSEARASRANEDKAVAALTTANNNNRALSLRLAEEQRIANELRESEREASTAHREAINAAKAKTITLTKTITIERQKDADLDTCLGVVWPDSIVRQLPQ